MNKFQQATPKGAANTNTDVWLTPSWIIEKLGPFDLDPCGHLPKGKPISPTAANYFTEKEDGLKQDWFGDVFVNFPYSQSKEWLEKCKYEFKNNPRVVSIIVLCFVRSETKAWQENVKSATGINLINRRIKFLNHLGEQKGNGNAPSCLIAWGARAFEQIKKVDGIICKI